LAGETCAIVAAGQQQMLAKKEESGMPTFRFEAMDNQGRKVQDTIQAADQAEAQQQLRRQGYFVSRIELVSDTNACPACGTPVDPEADQCTSVDIP